MRRSPVGNRIFPFPNIPSWVNRLSSFPSQSHCHASSSYFTENGSLKLAHSSFDSQFHISLDSNNVFISIFVCFLHVPSPKNQRQATNLVWWLTVFKIIVHWCVNWWIAKKTAQSGQARIRKAIIYQSRPMCIYSVPEHERFYLFANAFIFVFVVFLILLFE